MLPVPLNSSKITSSMREPVSTSAVPMIVRLPPSSIFRAAPKNRFGGYRAVESTPPDRIRPLAGVARLWARASLVTESSKDHDIGAHLDEPLGPFQRQVGNLGVFLSRSIKGRVDDLALDRALHVRDFLGPLIDEDHHQVALGIVGGDGVGDFLQHGRLTGLRRRDNHAALTLTNWRDEVDDPGQLLIGLALDLEPEPHVGKERCQFLEPRPISAFLGRQEVDGLYSGERREFLLGARRANRSADEIPLAESELANLARRDIDVLVSGQITRDPQEPVSLGKNVQDSLSFLQIAFRDLFLLTTAPASPAAPVAIAVLTVFTQTRPILPIAPLAAIATLG